MQTREANKRYYENRKNKKKALKEKLRADRIERSLLEDEKYWRHVKGFFGRYRINIRGDIFDIKNMKFLSPCLNSAGYKRVNLNKKGKVVQTYLHRVVAETFLGSLANSSIEFKDGDKLNTRVSNLILTKAGMAKYHRYRDTKEAERGILERGKLKKILIWLTEDGEYHDQRSVFAAKCFNNHLVLGNYWDYGGKEKVSSCKYCISNTPQTHAEAESILYDSGLVKEVIKFDTHDGKFHNPKDKVLYLCFNDHLNYKVFTDQRYTRRGCKRCHGSYYWEGDCHPSFRNNNQGAYLYICRFSNNNEKFYKIGITTTPINIRFPKRRISEYYIEPYLIVKLASRDAFNIEQQVLSRIENLSFKYNPKIDISGYTECFCKAKYREVVTMVENQIIKLYFGEDNPSSKLSEDAVKFIKTNCQPNHAIFGIKNLARMFRVHPKTIYNIYRGKTWKKVKPYFITHEK